MKKANEMTTIYMIQSINKIPRTTKLYTLSELDDTLKSFFHNDAVKITVVHEAGLETEWIRVPEDR